MCGPIWAPVGPTAWFGRGNIFPYLGAGIDIYMSLTLLSSAAKVYVGGEDSPGCGALGEAIA